MHLALGGCKIPQMQVQPFAFTPAELYNHSKAEYYCSGTSMPPVLLPDCVGVRPRK
jgi:hypothetical protein